MVPALMSAPGSLVGPCPSSDSSNMMFSSESSSANLCMYVCVYVCVCVCVCVCVHVCVCVCMD